MAHGVLERVGVGLEEQLVADDGDALRNVLGQLVELAEPSRAALVALRVARIRFADFDRGQHRCGGGAGLGKQGERGGERDGNRAGARRAGVDGKHASFLVGDVAGFPASRGWRADPIAEVVWAMAALGWPSSDADFNANANRSQQNCDGSSITRRSTSSPTARQRRLRRPKRRPVWPSLVCVRPPCARACDAPGRGWQSWRLPAGQHGCCPDGQC